ncbi:NupC/NupG family nucleoside CNT transporter [candidate division KSB1 bacterium]|nr:NupC/NupG family nucleoside CNT transporter [candidate division KSB1 bacterium]
MRFIGIIGILALLAIGVIFSTNRKAIKVRTVVWGLSLQLLFAAIILGKLWLSWLGMYLLFSLILFYIFQTQIITIPQTTLKIGRAMLYLLAGAVITLIGYLTSTVGIAVALFFIILIIAVVLNLLKKSFYNGYFFAILMQFGLGILFENRIAGRDIFRVLADKVDSFLKLSDLGSIFLFGNLAKPEYFDEFGFQFAFSVLPTIIFFSAVMSILYYLGVMQILVQMMARFMRWTLRTSGAETLSCSANVFVGQTEAPLLVRPFLEEMTPSELHAIMVGGFATIAGGVLAGYIRMGVDAGHLIAASVMSAPAALVMAKIFYPETEQSKTAGEVTIHTTQKASNILDATVSGVTDGLKLAVNVGAMLLAFIALIGLVDAILGYFDKLVDGQWLGGILGPQGEYHGIFPGSLKTFFGTLFSPLAFIMGVPWQDAMNVGNLLGIKVAVNEFVAYAELGSQIQNADMSPKAITIATYALCGFANFSSIGIQIGGISALAPSRRSALSKVALRAMFAGALASWLTATVAGILVY